MPAAPLINWNTQPGGNDLSCSTTIVEGHETPGSVQSTPSKWSLIGTEKTIDPIKVHGNVVSTDQWTPDLYGSHGVTTEGCPGGTSVRYGCLRSHHERVQGNVSSPSPKDGCNYSAEPVIHRPYLST